MDDDILSVSGLLVPHLWVTALTVSTCMSPCVEAWWNSLAGKYWLHPVKPGWTLQSITTSPTSSCSTSRQNCGHVLLRS